MYLNFFYKIIAYLFCRYKINAYLCIRVKEQTLFTFNRGGNTSIQRSFMKLKYIFCKYPENGFGGKNGQPYLMDQLGQKIDIENKYDECMDERYWCVDIPGVKSFEGKTVEELLETLRLYDIKIIKW